MEKRYLLRVDGETERAKTDFSLRVSKGKKSERKYRKGFFLLKSGEKENTEKDFSTLSIQKKE